LGAITKAFNLILSNNPTLNEIIFTTLKMALISSALSLLIGAPAGLILACKDFKGKKAVLVILRTLMGLPPVVVGIVLYVLFSGTGIFGRLNLIFTVELMIIAQVFLITPIVAGLTETAAKQPCMMMKETAKGLKMKGGKVFLLSLSESRYQLVAVYLFAFARAISEVGAVQIVGGNILHKTRVMTTTIALNYNTGQFTYAAALGIILLILTFAINLIAALIQFSASRAQRRRRGNENNG